MAWTSRTKKKKNTIVKVFVSDLRAYMCRVRGCRGREGERNARAEAEKKGEDEGRRQVRASVRTQQLFAKGWGKGRKGWGKGVCEVRDR